jgi:hypothetical protein
MSTFAETENVHYLFIICRPRKTNFRFRLQQTNESCHFPLVPFSVYKFQTENRSPGDFLNPFTLCSSCNGILSLVRVSVF